MLAMSLGVSMRCMSCALMNGAGQTSFKNKISVSWRWEFNNMPIMYGGGGPVAFFINQKRLFMDKLLSARITASPLAQLLEHRTSVRKVVGSNSDRTNPQALSISEEKVLPL